MYPDLLELFLNIRLLLGKVGGSYDDDKCGNERPGFLHSLPTPDALVYSSRLSDLRQAQGLYGQELEGGDKESDIIGPQRDKLQDKRDSQDSSEPVSQGLQGSVILGRGWSRDFFLYNTRR